MSFIGASLGSLAHVQVPDYIMVGDTEADLCFARDVGIMSCWASYGYGDRDGCRALAPDYEIAAFPGLIQIVSLARGLDLR
jgi:phosphoglycolate phosphatase